MYAIDRPLTRGKPMKVWLETITTYRTRSGRPGKKQRWVAEVGEPSDTFALIGRGRTRREAITNLGPRAYDMDFDSTAWKVRYVFGLRDDVSPALGRLTAIAS